MPVKEARSRLVFVVEDLIGSKLLTVHAQRINPYPITRKSEYASGEIKQQITHFNTSYHLINDIRDIRNHKGEFEVLIMWARFEGDTDITWEPLHRIKEDVPGVLEDLV